MIIESLDNKKIKDLKRLSIRKCRDKENIFLVEGEHLVLEAYKNGLLLELILEEKELFSLDIKTTYVSNKVINYLSSLTTPSTIIGVCKKKEHSTILGNRLLLLDNIQDPGNLGTIIRSAVAFNVDTIILGNGTVDIYNPKVLRATQGLIFHINIYEDDLNNIIPDLKMNNYTIIGTSIKNGENLKNYHSVSKYALIMGNEGHGINEEITKLCDDFIYIKMNNECESLNVGVACSIILYQLDVR